jgi:hypothetical protein
VSVERMAFLYCDGPCNAPYGGAIDRGRDSIREQRAEAHDQGWISRYVRDNRGRRVLHDYCPVCAGEK